MINLSWLRKSLSTVLVIFILLLGSIFVGNFSEPALANSLVQNVKSSETENAEYSGLHRNLQEGKQEYNSQTKALGLGSSAAEMMNAKQNHLKDSQTSSQMAQKSNKEMMDNHSNGIQRAAYTIREKLNLDEPIPQSTKDFLNDVQQKVDDVVAPIAGQ